MHRTAHAAQHLPLRNQGQSSPPRGRRFAALALACLFLTSGCAAGSSSGQEEPAASQAEPTVSRAAPAASMAPVVLRIATNDGPDTPTGAAIAAYARAVGDLSDGSMRVEPAWEAAGNPLSDWDQAVAQTVIDGANQLGYIPARAFDVLGVDTLQPLQTPFLLATARRAEEVVRSPLADELMEGVEDIGLTGLGLFPEDLRRIFSYAEPITQPSQLEDRSIRAPRSDMTQAVFGSVRAEVTDISGDAWGEAVAQGQVHGAETSLAAMAGLASEHPATTVAGNIVLFPKINVLVVNRAAFEELDEEQRALLRQAAVVTAALPELGMNEIDTATAYCAAGGRVIEAPAADVTALMSVMSATTLPRSSARAVELVEAIEDLVTDLPQIEPVAPCEPATASRDGSSAPAVTTGDVLLSVDTQIGDGAPASPVVAAAPAFESCTTVRDLAGSIDDSDPAELRFAGTKLIECADGNVTIEYEASMDTAVPGITSGTWRITESSLPTARTGGGQLGGDGGTCQAAAPGVECIRDTYRGTVSP